MLHDLVGGIYLPVLDLLGLPLYLFDGFVVQQDLAELGEFLFCDLLLLLVGRHLRLYLAEHRLNEDDCLRGQLHVQVICEIYLYVRVRTLLDVRELSNAEVAIRGGLVLRGDRDWLQNVDIVILVHDLYSAIR